MCVAGPHVMHLQARLFWLQNTAKGLKTNGRVVFIPPQWRCHTGEAAATAASASPFACGQHFSWWLEKSFAYFHGVKCREFFRTHRNTQVCLSKLPHLLDLLFFLGLPGRWEERLHTSHGANTIWAALLLCMDGATRLEWFSLPQGTLICS